MIGIDIKVVGLDRGERYLNKIITRLPKELNKLGIKVTNDIKRGLKEEINERDMRWMDILYNSIRRKKLKNNEYAIVMRDYGVYLDAMQEHDVVVKGKPVLEQWVEDNLDKEVYKIRVSPRRGWIMSGIGRGMKRFGIRNKSMIHNLTKGD